MATHRVLYDFSGEEKNMMKVKAGEIVKVLSTSNNWCTVQKGSSSGLVPATYLEAVLPEVSTCIVSRTYKKLYFSNFSLI